jgi:hypothetical protein
MDENVEEDAYKRLLEIQGLHGDVLAQRIIGVHVISAAFPHDPHIAAQASALLRIWLTREGLGPKQPSSSDIPTDDASK